MKKKALALTIVPFSLAFLAACGAPAPTPAPAPETPPAQQQTEAPATQEVAETADAPSRDLDGLEIVIAQWWGGWDTDTFEPTNPATEAQLAHRIAVEQRYNFRVREINVGGWGEFNDGLVADSLLAGSPVGHVIRLTPPWFARYSGHGFFADISGTDFNDRSVVDWHQATTDLATIGGNIYGFATGIGFGGGVYFNQRLFEEAGLDRDLPFDLVAGTADWNGHNAWTWAAFLDLAHALTRDTTATGYADTWGVVSFSNDILTRAAHSNGSPFITQDAQGNFVNNTMSPGFLEAVDFVNGLHEAGVLMPQPEGSEWDWFNEAFWSGHAAMRSGAHYLSGGTIRDNLVDDWGFVPFPMGPRETQFVFHGYQNINVIPMQYQDIADDIMFAMIEWSRTPEGFDDPSAWMANELANHPSQRSVFETMELYSRGHGQSLGRHEIPLNVLIPGLNIGDIAWQMWHGDGLDAVAIVERDHLVWNELVDAVNN